MTSIISQWNKAFPNLTVHWQQYTCEDDRVVSQWYAEDIHEAVSF